MDKPLGRGLVIVAIVVVVFLALGGIGGASASGASDAEASFSKDNPNVTVENRSVSPESATTGDQVQLSATVSNVGTTDETATVLFLLENRQFTQTVTLEPGDQASVSVNTTVDRAGSHYVRIGGQDVGTITVDSRLNVVSHSTNASQIDIGDSVKVTTTLENPHSEEVTENVEFSLGDTSVVRNVTIPADSTSQHRANLTASSSGEQSLRIAGEWIKPVEVNGVLEAVPGSVSITPQTLTLGESVQVNATLRNPNGSEYTVDRYVTVYSLRGYAGDELTLQPGEEQDINVTLTPNQIGTDAPVVVGDVELGTIDVEHPFDITSIETNPSSIELGESVEVTTTLKNTQSERVTKDVRIQLGDDSVVRNASISAGNNQTFSAVLTPDQSGTEFIHVDGLQTDTSVEVESVLETVPGSTSITPRSLTLGESIQVNATLRNPNGSGVTVDQLWGVHTLGAAEPVDVSLEPGEEQDINVTLTPEQAGTDLPVVIGDIEVGTIDVENPVTAEVVDVENVVAAGDTANVTVQLTNRNSELNQSRTLTAGAVQPEDTVTTTETFDIAPGASKNVTLGLQLNQSADWDLHTPFDNEYQHAGVVALNDTTGTANLSVEYPEDYVVSTKTSGHLWTPIYNDGDADGAQMLTLRDENGTLVDRDVVHVPANDQQLARFPAQFDTPTNESWYLNGNELNVTVRAPVVTSGDVTAVGNSSLSGTAYPEGGYRNGEIDIELRANTSQAQNNLSKIGADQDTRFAVNTTLRNFEPNAVVANGRNVSWETTNVSEDKVRVTVYASPVETSSNYSAPSLDRWDDDDLTADRTVENLVRFRIYGDAPDGSQDYTWADGLVVSSNAQGFDAPRYHSTDDGGRFDVEMAAPHFREDGTINEGNYTARIPQHLLDSWDVEDTDELAGAWTAANDTNVTVVNGTDGMTVEMDLHYSSGTAIVGEESAVKAATGEQTNADDGNDGDDSGGGGGGYFPAPPADDEEPSDDENTSDDGTDDPEDDGSDTGDVDDSEETPDSGDDPADESEGDDVDETDESDDDSSDTEDGEDGNSDDGSPGFGAVAGIVAIILGLLVRRGVQS